MQDSIPMAVEGVGANLNSALQDAINNLETTAEADVKQAAYSAVEGARWIEDVDWDEIIAKAQQAATDQAVTAVATAQQNLNGTLTIAIQQAVTDAGPGVDTIIQNVGRDIIDAADQLIRTAVQTAGDEVAAAGGQAPNVEKEVNRGMQQLWDAFPDIVAEVLPESLSQLQAGGDAKLDSLLQTAGAAIENDISAFIPKAAQEAVDYEQGGSDLDPDPAYIRHHHWGQESGAI